jgi:phosphatidylglycerophosphatase A
MKTDPAWLFATWFGCGHFPKGPGTAGSLGALLVALPLVYAGLPSWGFLLLSLVLLYPGIAASSSVAIRSGLKDPQIVVIDEVLGQWITLAGAAVLNWKSFLLAFVLFRLFDILKPPPIRRLERIPGGAGIVLDDFLAGVYGAIVLAVAGRFGFY